MPHANRWAMVAEAWGGSRHFQALAALCLLLAGCAATAPGGAPKVAKSYHSMPEAALPLPPPSSSDTLADYQREIAGLLHAANPGMIYEGPPPNPLRAVVVVHAEIDALGETRRLDLYRVPGYAPWLEELVAQTVRQATPFPRPSLKLLNGARSVAFTESWLFDYQGRFRLRTLSQRQAEPPDEGDEDSP
jgi:hypothetical protein